MSTQPESNPEQRKYIVVDSEVLGVLHATHVYDPEDSQKLTHELVETDHEFAHAATIEAFQRSRGDIRLQEMFLAGVSYAHAAHMRTRAIEASLRQDTVPNEAQPAKRKNHFLRFHRLGATFVGILALGKIRSRNVYE